MRVREFIGIMAVALSAASVGGAPVGEPAPYVPAPQPADTGRTLVGAFMCPLWNEASWNRLGRRDAWGPVLSFPERKPLLGWYDEGHPEVTDWEITWALDHGIRFFVPCWYRARGNAGKPVEQRLGHWLDEGLFRSRYGERFRFAILWENGNRIASGVESEQDLRENLLTYWIDRYFRRPEYLLVDGKPVLFIYRMDILVTELGGIEPTRRALANMRGDCVAAGFKGLIVVGEHHLRVDRPVPHLAETGIDYACSYHWPTFSRLMPADRKPEAVIRAQKACRDALPSAAGVPAIATVSVGWDARPWHGGSDPGWQLAPEDFGALCREVKSELDSRSGGGLDATMVLIDNWNEFGEGHFVFPHARHRFAYLDAIRSVFAPDAPDHRDAVPEDVGLGPYDSMHRALVARRRELGGWDVPDTRTELIPGADGLRVTASDNDPQLVNAEVPACSGSLRLTVTLIAPARATVQVFWTTAGSASFAAERCASAEAAPGPEPRDVAIEFVADDRVRRIRLDPCTEPGTVVIRRIRLEAVDGGVIREWRFGDFRNEEAQGQ